MSEINDYFKSMKKIIDSIDRTAIDAITDIMYRACSDDGTIFVAGNGGSASTASHFVCDLTGITRRSKKKIKAISINDNISVITAISNDSSYGEVFREQLYPLMGKDDILVLISASGNSDNILLATKYANESHFAKTIGLVGFDGGELKENTDINVIVDSFDYGLVENAHLIICHLISRCLEKKIEGNAREQI